MGSSAPQRPSALLAEFLVYLGAELQLSPHTVAAYRRDLDALLARQQDLTSGEVARVVEESRVPRGQRVLVHLFVQHRGVRIADVCAGVRTARDRRPVVRCVVLET